MMTETQPSLLAGLGEVADRYDAFFIDQFGVLHDGTTPYPHAAAALRALRDADKQVVLLSNSGKRSAPNVARLGRLGFTPDSYTLLLSSGEVGWTMLEATGVAQRCLLIARDGDRSAVEGLPITVTTNGRDCDFVLIAGSEGDTRSLDDYRALLGPAAARDVPAYCTNPDTHMLTPGGLRFGAGQIATLYEVLGGEVTWIGKPFPVIYAAARAAVGDISASRILCIGDSIEHDIAGARGAGLDSCLITGGILADASPQELPALFDRAGAPPEFQMTELRW
ncbi:TIGR01459 family HAD-type hydrolase [Sphingomonas sp.]|uniref:TIGR01459 family HAD-type hydrolase n=1 Tax=Sphingomonas sp. TaxID=28214 RepID=UPI001ED4D25D|nr:TIGR01459 family HAD-type hydrolase [Sphingomonas sp.]MBX3593553.1 TIGR01459 family HAD-type hydrolase [Sphingomonas sp.]